MKGALAISRHYKGDHVQSAHLTSQKIFIFWAIMGNENVKHHPGSCYDSKYTHFLMKIWRFVTEFEEHFYCNLTTMDSKRKEEVALAPAKYPGRK